MFGTTNAAEIAKSIATGAFQPNIRLTNLSTAYFQADDDFVATKLFPQVPVQLSTSRYYKFSKADLARDNMQRKPAFGKVTPMPLALADDLYDCKIDQLIIGIDQLSALNYQRTNAPGVADPRAAKVRAATEQAKLHMDILFAQNYFKTGVWTTELTGKTTIPGSNEFWQFDNANSDPVKIIDTLSLEIKRNGRRRPNKIGLGAETFRALKNNASVLERIKYSGSTANPATVNENVLAQLFGVSQVAVLESTYNAADIGKTEDMQFVCDPKGALLLYAPDSPQIDEPSAGYTFMWDMLGDGSPMPMTQWLGESGTHSEFIEGLCAPDMKIVGQDLAVYLGSCVG
ncbi:MAG: hypothetical protein VB031_02195 [Eubacteriaceae bacterium]|nr:hypothetical protein [Eubacteriaceae bacterium]